MTLQTWVARFVVENGRVTEEGGRLRTFQRRRIDEPEIDLHILAEPVGAKGEELGAQALDAIGRLFLQDRLSLTGALLRSLHGTHVTLLDWNRRSLPGDQASLGLIGAVTDGNIVYLARCGPGVVLFRHLGELKRLEPQGPAQIALGEDGVEPDLQRFEMTAGDVLIGASAALETVIDLKLMDDLLARGSEEALPDLYLLTRDLPRFALFAVTCTEVPEGEPISDDIATAKVAASMVNAEPPSAPGAEVRRQPGPRPRPRSTEQATSPGQTVSPTSILDIEHIQEARPQSLTFEPMEAEDETGPLLVAPPPLDISRPVVKLRNTPATSRSDYPRTTGAPRLNLAINQRVIFATAAVALAIFIAIFVLPDLVRQNRGEKVQNLIATSQTQLNAALIEQDPARKRLLLDETRRLASEALRVDPQNSVAADLRQQAADNLTLLDAVVDLGAMTTINTLSRQVTGDVSVSRLIVAGGNGYLIDDKDGRVFSLSLAGASTPLVVYQDGQSYLGTPAKKPIFFAWEGPPDTGRLLILDSERKLFEVRPGGQPTPLPLRRTNTWSSVAGMAAYDGNLYILDPDGNQVHRYLPAATGFDSEPGPALSGQQSLSEAEGIAVYGDIYVYFKNGSVRRFTGGVDSGFSFAGIDRSPRTITDIEVLPAGQGVYLADSGNKRVVVLGPDGVFRRQLVSSAFTDIRGIGVDPVTSLLYVIVGDTVLSAPITP